MPDAFRTVFPAPERLLDPSSPDYRPGLAEFAPGGRYLMMPGAFDVTDRTVARAVIDVTYGQALLRVAGLASVNPSFGRILRINLFRATAGWKWVSRPPLCEHVDTLISIEGSGEHVYALRVEIETPLHLSRYTNKTEPRLRPTTHGVILLGPAAGTIRVRKREHPVYGLITVERK